MTYQVPHELWCNYLSVFFAFLANPSDQNWGKEVWSDNAKLVSFPICDLQKLSNLLPWDTWHSHSNTAVYAIHSLESLVTKHHRLHLSSNLPNFEAFFWNSRYTPKLFKSEKVKKGWRVWVLIVISDKCRLSWEYPCHVKSCFAF